MRIIQLGLTAAGTLAALIIAPRVELTRDSVEVPIPPADLIALFHNRFTDSPENILAMEPDRVVRRFAGREGPFRFKTVEVVRFEGNSISFEHLAGPFSECNERFEFTATPSGTRLTHFGSFRLRGGLWTAGLALGPVKRAFQNHVRGHLESLAAEYAPR